MENKNTLVAFNEVRSSMMFYCNELAHTYPDDNTFVLYQYAPYLVANKVEWFTNTLNWINNPYLKLLVYTQRLIEACGSFLNFTIKEAKQNILSIMDDANRETTSTFGEKFKKKVCEIGNDLIDIIRKKQSEDKSLESAMLNYSPIVQYQGRFLKPAEFAEKYTFLIQKQEPDFSELDQLIKDLFFDYVFYIAKNPEAFIPIDHMNPLFLNTEVSGLGYPMALINIHHEISIISKSKNCRMSESEFFAKVYFALVYLRFVVKSTEWRSFLDDLFKINNIYNKISNGERINIPVAMETLSSVSPELVMI